MISSPSTADLIRGVRTELAARVLPCVHDSAVVLDLHMMLSLLDTLAVRSQFELAWMSEEIDAIGPIAGQAARELEGTDELREVLSEISDTDPSSMYAEDVSRRYQAASKALAIAVDLAIKQGHHELEVLLVALVRARLVNEQRVIGAFQAAGR